jgi:predicted nucleotide-binding protein with TIR-like domain
LARVGHQLFVQSDRPDSADRHVVNGYLEIAGTAGSSAHRIAIWRPMRSDRLVFDAEIERYPTVFAFENTEAGKWDSARFNMCHAAQATIIVAGQARSETTGYTVMSAGKLLIPISNFGGAAETLLARLEHQFLNARRLPEPLTIADLKQPWSDALLRRVSSCLEAPQLTVVIIHGRDRPPVDELIAFIATRGFGQPILMQSEFKPGETLPEKWERIAGGDNTVAIAVCTADDVGRYRANTDLSTRTRQNVWLEVGWFWGKYQTRGRLLLLPQRWNDKRLEIPSDLDGLETFEWRSSPLERRDEISRFLETFRH